MSALQPNLPAALSFVEWHRPGGPWTLTAIRPDRQEIQTRTFTDKGELAQWFTKMAPSYNLYFALNPLTRLMNKKAEREDIASMDWLHVDIDPRAGEQIDVEQTRALEKLQTRLPDGIPKPSAIIFSGGGYQGFWKLDEPFEINGKPELYEEAKLYNMALELAFGGDHCHNVDRIMRLPGSINWPNKKKASKGRVPVLAEAVQLDDIRYPISLFKKSAPANPSSVQPLVDVGDLSQHGLSERLVVIATHGCHPEEAEKPSRSEWVFDFCCNARRDGVSDDAVCAILLDARHRISESVLENGRNAERYARRQIERARAVVDSGPLVLSKDEPLRSARAFVAHHFPNLLHHNGDWLAHSECAYQELETDTIKSELYPFLDRAVVVVIKEKQPVELPFCPNRHKIADVLEALKSETHAPREKFSPPCWLNGDGPPAHEVLACRNGLVHLPSGELLPPTERFFTRNALEFAFDPTAPEPTRWLAFLREVWPDGGGEVEVLQEMFGYFLTPDTSQQKIFLLVGPKRSGKGTIGRVLTQLIGKRNVCAPSLDDLANNFGMEPLLGKQLAVVSDMRAGRHTDTAKLAENLLRLSGEDEVTVARKYKGAWTGRLNVRFVIMTNEMPEIRDSSGALASRFIPITMAKSFFGREDTKLDAKLRGELPGILNWAIAGRRRLAERGHFEIPNASREALVDLENLSSPVQAFLREMCDVTAEGVVPKAEVFGAWRGWCQRENYLHPGNAAVFSKQLIAATDHRVRSAKLHRDGSRAPCWLGLKLLRPPTF